MGYYMEHLSLADKNLDRKVEQTHSRKKEKGLTSITH